MRGESVRCGAAGRPVPSRNGRVALRTVISPSPARAVVPPAQAGYHPPPQRGPPLTKTSATALSESFLPAIQSRQIGHRDHRDIEVVVPLIMPNGRSKAAVRTAHFRSSEYPLPEAQLYLTALRAQWLCGTIPSVAATIRFLSKRRASPFCCAFLTYCDNRKSILGRSDYRDVLQMPP